MEESPGWRVLVAIDGVMGDLFRRNRVYPLALAAIKGAILETRRATTLVIGSTCYRHGGGHAWFYFSAPHYDGLNMLRPRIYISNKGVGFS